MQRVGAAYAHLVADWSPFSPEAFDSLDADQRRALAEELNSAVTADLMAGVRDRMEIVVSALNGLGHELRLTDDGDDARGYNDGRGGAAGLLRLAVDVVVSSGYADMVEPDTVE
jgi:hypothetical protein